MAGLLVAVVAPGAAWAQSGNDNYPPSTTVTTNPCTTTQRETGICGTSATVPQDPGGDELPFTGGDVALLTVLGLVAAGGGVLLVWLGRRQRSTA